MKRVGSLGSAGGLRPIFAWAAGSVVAPSMGRDLAGFCAMSLGTEMKSSVRNRGKAVPRETRGDNSFDIGIVYA
jgi:hypothetical protein